MSPKELRSRRLSLGLTIAQLAHELGLAISELQEMEHAQLALPPDRHLVAALAALEECTGPMDCLPVEDDHAVSKLVVPGLRA